MTLTQKPHSALDRKKGVAGGLTALALMIVTLALLTSGALMVPRAPERTAPASTTVTASASPQAPAPRSLTFYMHNNTLAKDVSGVSTPYIFHTLQ